MLAHLLELRRRLILITLIFLAFMVGFLGIAPSIFYYAVMPLRQALPNDDPLIATDLMTPLFTPLQMAIDVALLATIPVLLFHLWRFAVPGLYQHERRWICVAMGLSLALFCLGAVFCFFGVLPLLLKYLVQTVPSGVRLMPDMATSVHFITRMLILFGLSFQVPLICCVLVKAELVTLAQLKQARPYWIVCAFILGMLLTPPDVISQITLAIPLCLLYELGIGLVVMIRVFDNYGVSSS